MRASVITLGCKVNEYESQSMLSQLKNAGYEISEGLVEADLYIVNTCAVTNTAEKKSRQVLAKLNKLNPNAKIVITGCASQNNCEQFLKNKNVTTIIGTQGKEDILNHINAERKFPLEIKKEYTKMSTPIATRTRQYIKIQDGCDYFCSYCLIPYMRGRSRSRDIKSILDEIKSLNASEIVLTGINMSDYKLDGKLALKELIKAVDNLGKRFRLSSIECNVLDDEMIEILKNCKHFCPHFHLSLQSACNDTLKRMNRRYTIEQFIEITDKIKSNFPLASISTDIIVGFKGESEREFNETIKNLERIQFSFMHIFPYSERSGTVASAMKGDVDVSTKKQREEILKVMNTRFKKANFAKNRGTIHEVLVEETLDDKFSLGYTDNYIYTYIRGLYPVGSIQSVELDSTFKDGMLGVVK